MSGPTQSSAGSKTERFEYKYHLDVVTYHRLRGALRGLAHHDRHCERAPDNRYLVRSLYFDDSQFQAYQEKVWGVPGRIKLRLRSYWREREQAPFVNVEIKTKNGYLVNKFADRVDLAEYDSFLATRSWIQQNGSVADEFRRLTVLKGLEPVVLIDYDREALLARDHRDVRITFDHAVRYARSRELFPPRVTYQPSRPRRVILEIKARSHRPRWLEDLVRRYQLQSLPNSKYARAVEQTQPTFFTPAAGVGAD